MKIMPFVRKEKYEKLQKEAKNLEGALAAQIEDNVRLTKSYDKKIKDMQEEERSRWAPFLKRLMTLSVEKVPSYGYKLSVAFDDTLINAAASYNSNHYWDYFCEQVAYDLKRQLATLNFAGLHKMSEDMEEKKYQLRNYGFTPQKGWK